MIDAAFDLILEGKIPPAVHDVAERAGVSVSSVFRQFDGLTDLQQQTIEQFRARYWHFIAARPDPGTDLDARIRLYVRNRVSLYAQALPLLMLARSRALEHQAMAEAVAYNRAALLAQTREWFRPETADCATADAADLVSLIDSLTCPEAFDLLSRAHHRSDRQVSRSWRSGLRALMAEWPPV
ncbi:hypothetical protein ACX9NE_28020 [Mycobacterium sp. ML4]